MYGLVTYLKFDGNCKEAMEFYSKCLGAEMTSSKFSEGPGDPAKVAAVKDRIMHARLLKGAMPLLMASDIMPGMGQYQPGNNFSVTIGCESKEEIQKIFAALSEGGSVTMPLADQFWGSHFGMLRDKFGVEWMLNYEYPKQG